MNLVVEMDCGYFAAKSYLVGATDEEASRLINGEPIDPTRLDTIYCHMKIAAINFARAQVEGRC